MRARVVQARQRHVPSLELDAARAVHGAAPEDATSRPISARSCVVSSRSDWCSEGPAASRVDSILSFLEDAEEASRIDASRLDLDETLGAVHAPVPVASGVQAMRGRVQMLEVEVSDKKATIAKLRAALAKQGEREKEIEANARLRAEERLQQQKQDYEATLDRNLKLVDRLLGDKAELTRKCQQFQEDMRALEQKTQLQLEASDDKAAKELARQKANWATAEKLRREAWEKEKVKETKELARQKSNWGTAEKMRRE